MKAHKLEKKLPNANRLEQQLEYQFEEYHVAHLSI